MWPKLPKPILALAPMADMTDSPFCQICREVAGKDFVIFREMVSAEAIVRASEKTLKMCEFTELERPIVLQIFGPDADVIRKAARIVVDKFHPDGIDINMGCPVPKIAGKSDSGAALMKDPERAVEIVKSLKKENLGVSISVKTRLGWMRGEDILEFAPRLEQAGIDAITVHGRTKTQGYAGAANWEIIGEVKKRLTIPVIANGDIVDTKSVQHCLEVTGADGVMIGRGALGKPWVLNYGELRNVPSVIPSEPQGEPRNPLNIGQEGFLHSLRRSVGMTKANAIDVIVRTMLRHAELHLARYGERGMVTFRKHLAWYFKANKIGTEIPKLKELRSRLVRVKTMEELESLLAFYT